MCSNGGVLTEFNTSGAHMLAQFNGGGVEVLKQFNNYNSMSQQPSSWQPY